MTDTKYTSIPVSDPDEKDDPNASAEQQEPEQHQYQRRGWCRRWRARHDGEENPRRRRWRIVRRIFLAIILIHIVKYAFRARFRPQYTPYDDDEIFSEESVFDFIPYDPTFEDPEFYGTDLANQDPIAQELFDEFNYVFRGPLDFDSNSFGDRWADFKSEDDLLDFPEDEPPKDELEGEFPKGHEGEFPRGPEGEFPKGPEGEPPKDEPEEGEPGNEDPKDPEDPDHPPHRRPHPPPPHPPHRRPHPPPPHPICNETDLIPWDGPSEITFSPDEFKSFALLLNGATPPPAIVKVHQLDDSDPTENIAVKLTILIGEEKLNNLISASAYDHEGTFVVEVTTPKHPPRGPPSPKHCIKIHIDIGFPAGLDAFGDFSLRLSHAIVKAQSLGDIYFDNFNAGVGRGALLFRHVSANNVRLGAAQGFIGGKFDIGNNATFGTIKGASHAFINPVGDVLHLQAATVSGAVSVKIPTDAYEGRFVLATLFGQPTITAPNPSDVHVEKLKPNFKAGYYKTKTESVAVLSARHGKVDLTFE